MKHNYYSQQYGNCNENDNEYVTIEYERTLFQSLFNKPRKVVRFEKIEGAWCYFGSKNEVIINDWLKIQDVIERIETNNFPFGNYYKGLK